MHQSGHVGGQVASAGSHLVTVTLLLTLDSDNTMPNTCDFVVCCALTNTCVHQWYLFSEIRKLGQCGVRLLNLQNDEQLEQLKK